MNPHQRCLQAKVKYRNEPKQVMPKSEDPSRSLEINAIWTFDTEFSINHAHILLSSLQLNTDEPQLASYTVYVFCYHFNSKKVWKEIGPSDLSFDDNFVENNLVMAGAIPELIVNVFNQPLWTQMRPQIYGKHATIKTRILTSEELVEDKHKKENRNY